MWTTRTERLAHSLASLGPQPKPQQLIDLSISVGLFLDEIPADVTKEQFGEVVKAGGLEFLQNYVLAFCHAAPSTPSTSDSIADSSEPDESPYLPIITVLYAFEHWMTVMVNAFDDTLGMMPLLSYYLCERDRYSVDITWRWEDAHRLASFLGCMIQVLERDPAPCEDTEMLEHELRAARDLIGAVCLHSPPLRTTPQSMKVCADNLDTILRTSSDDAYVELPVIAGVVSLGLGLTFDSGALEAEAQRLFRRELTPGRRCTCATCERWRRTHQVLTAREGYGNKAFVEGSMYLKSKGQEAGAVDEALKLLQGALIADKTEMSLLSARSGEADEAKAGQIADEAYESCARKVRMDRLALYAAIVFQVVGKTKAVAQSDVIEASLSFVSHFVKTYGLECTNGGLGFGILALIAWLSYELFHNPERNISLKHELSRLIYQICHGYLTHQEDKRRLRCLRLMPALSALCLASCALAEATNDSAAEGLDQELKVAQFWEEDEDHKLLVDTVASMADTVCDLEVLPKRFEEEFGGLVSLLGIVTGVREYQQSNELRRVILHPPPARCGTLVYVARRLVEFRKAKLQGCVFLKIVLETALQRAEKASALVHVQADGP